MQFKHPEIIYALFLLLIPIIVHLFQLRKFKKEQFTNVAFLKEVSLQTRKSSQIKKWLTLLTRLGLLVCLILAFAQPFTSKTNSFNTEKETVIYLDNSYSMQAKGEKGPLLKRAVQDIISNVPETETISLLTNNDSYRNTTIKAIKNDLLQLDYCSNQLSYNSAILKAKKLFNKNRNTVKNLVFISDFQEKDNYFSAPKDTILNINLVPLKPVAINNVAIDSTYISKRTASNLELSVVLKNTGNAINNIPVSLFNDNNLVSKSSVSLNGKASAIFTLPNNQVINGKITIDDTNLQFDNTLFFNINSPEKINVLAVSQANDDFLKRIYTVDEFNFTSVKPNTLNYNDITSQNVIVLNELASIPVALTTALKSFAGNGGKVVFIPKNKGNLQNYNSFLSAFGFTPFQALQTSEKRLTTINYSHPLYADGVFEKRVKNFQYPKISQSFSQTLTRASAVLQYENLKPFLSQYNNTYVFTGALNKENTNFKGFNLIVPTFYNIAKQSLKLSNLYYTIGKNNNFDVNTSLQQDAVLTLENGVNKVIPQQTYFNNKVAITTNETPEFSGVYQVKNKAKIIENVSYNYNRNESNLVYQNLDGIENVTINNSITNLFDSLKSDTKVNELWKWFVIFALVFLITEMLILKYFK